MILSCTGKSSPAPSPGVCRRSCPAQVPANSDGYEEHQCIVQENIRGVIGRSVEQLDDEQVVEHDRDQHPGTTDAGIILQGEAFPVHKPPPRDKEGKRGKDHQEDPAHDG